LVGAGTVGGATKADAFPGYRDARKAAMFAALNGDAVFDSPLTAQGIEQAEALQPEAKRLVEECGVEVVLTSSLRRTTLTAWTAFGGLVPIVAWDELREVAGAFDCERRAVLSQQIAMFPKVDFTACSEEDTLWVQYYRDANAQAVTRGVEVLDRIIDSRWTSLAVVSHGAFSHGAVFDSPHPRINSTCSPPRLNCEVVGVRIDRDGAGVFTLSPLEDVTAKL
jgi:broad specificity phosphatase PhoE